MKNVKLTDRQMTVLMNLGQAVDDALIEFRGRTVAEVSAAAHQAFASMTALRLPAPAVPAAKAPVRRKRRKAAKKAAAKKAAAKPAVKADGKAQKVMKVISGLTSPVPASEIAEKMRVSGQGLGPVLNMLHTDGHIVKREKDGIKMWGPKLNGKSNHVSVN